MYREGGSRLLPAGPYIGGVSGSAAHRKRLPGLGLFLLFVPPGADGQASDVAFNMAAPGLDVALIEHPFATEGGVNE